jgi:hypothetical protein
MQEARPEKATVQLSSLFFPLPVAVVGGEGAGMRPVRESSIVLPAFQEKEKGPFLEERALFSGGAQ